MTEIQALAPAERLYQLLPAFHRQRDLEAGGPLRALLTVIAEQVRVVEADIERLYENWFIETCEDWVIPYLGELVGTRAGAPGASLPRRRVANSIRARRRKGTLALLEELALDVTSWPSHAVELYRRLAFNQHLDHRRPDRGRLVDLRQPARLARLFGPFDGEAHLPDFRDDGGPRFDLSTVALFLWRLGAYSVTHTPAACLESTGSHCFTFSVLGNDTPLYNRPVPEPGPTHLSEPLNLPAPIARADFAVTATVDGHTVSRASPLYYGGRSLEPDKPPTAQSLLIWAPGFPTKNAPQPLPASLIVPADLDGWQYRPPRGLVAVDPQRGRIVFPPGQAPKRGVWVSYHYGFSADLGGGEYERPLSGPPVEPLRVGHGEEHKTINGALEAWGRMKEKPSAAIIEITDSAVYSEKLSVTLGPGESLQLRAANRARPVLRLLDYLADSPDAFSVTGARGSRFVLDGLLVAGRGLRVYGRDPRDEEEPDTGDLCDVTIRHCTLVPGWTLDCDCAPCEPNEPSLELINTRATVRIERSIIGSISVVADEVMTDPLAIELCGSIVDATAPERVAVGTSDGRTAFAVLTVRASTILGRTEVHAIDLGQDSLFQGTVRVARRQRGCLRFCYLPADSRAPRQFECQPQLVDAAVAAAITGLDERAAEQERERDRVRPRFTSTRYGTPAYAQLAQGGPPEIARGAEDQSELGVFRDLHQPQRIDELRATVDEHTPAGTSVALVFVT